MSDSRPMAARETAYLGSQAQDYDARRFARPQGRVIGEMEAGQLMAVLNRLDAGSSVLEVGVGTGRFVALALAQGHACSGIDASPDMLEQTRAKLANEGSLRLECAEAAVLPFEDNRFDCVYSIRVMNQTESADYALRAVREMYRVVRPGGWLLVEFVNSRRLTAPGNHRRNVRLSHDQVEAALAGARLACRSGCFLFGMTAFNRCPAVLLAALSRLDRAFSRAFPRLCARGYVAVRKPQDSAA